MRSNVHLACRWSKLLLWIALLLPLIAGCAYFNTFYFAKKHFKEAEAARLKSEVDKLNPEAAKKYDDAITQCGKVLTFHGGSRWVDDAIYLMGASYYGKREYDLALKKFDELLVNYPKSNLVPSTHYMIGLCHFERTEFEQMETAFGNALEADHDFEHRDDILFTLAKAAEAKRDRVLAIRRYRELNLRHKDSRRGEEALLAIGNLYFEAGRTNPAYYDSAYASFSGVARTTHDDKTYHEGETRAAECLIRLGRPEEAALRLERILPKDERQNRQVDDWPARVRIVLAQAQNETGRHTEALETLRGVTDLYPSSTQATEAQFQIGFTYEEYMDSLSAAEAAYDKASKLSTRSVFREQAETRVKNLRKLQELSSEMTNAATSDEEKRAEALLQMGELHYLSEKQIDEALRQYREVIRQFPETRIAPRAAYAVAYIHLKDVEGKRDSALVELADLIRTYPASHQAKAALDFLVAEQADTSGLGGLLIEPEPEVPLEPPPTEPLVDSLAVLSDSLVGPPYEGAASSALPSDQELGLDDPERRFMRFPEDSLRGRFPMRPPGEEEDPDRNRDEGNPPPFDPMEQAPFDTVMQNERTP